MAMQLRVADKKPFARSEFANREAPDVDQREFPVASATPHLPKMIRDEILDFYAFLFRQRGFCQIGMTFEQFLIVIATVKPGDLLPAIDEPQESLRFYKV